MLTAKDIPSGASTMPTVRDAGITVLSEPGEGQEVIAEYVLSNPSCT